MPTQEKEFQSWTALTHYLNGKGHFRMDLSFIRIEKTLHSLNLTRPPFLFVQIVGTNGKGSTSTFLSQMLAEQGITVGLHTSPHLFSLAERILLQNQRLSTATWLKAANELVLHGGLALTYFEFVTCLAVLIFAQNGVQVAIMETGLGGTFDATSAFTADIIAFTPIDFDHMNILGNSLKEIAQDKAGAIRANLPVLSVPQHQDVAHILEQKALEQRAPLLYCQPQKAENGEKATNYPLAPQASASSPIDIVWDWCPKNELPVLSLAGEHQYTNAALATALFRLIGHTLHSAPKITSEKPPTHRDFKAENLCASIQHPFNPKAEQQGLSKAHIAGRMQHTPYLPPSSLWSVLGAKFTQCNLSHHANSLCTKLSSKNSSRIQSPCVASPRTESLCTDSSHVNVLYTSFCPAHFPHGLPPMILDGAHNASGLAALGLALAKQKTAPLATIFSCLHDKDIGVLIAHVRTMSTGRIFVPPITNNPRASNPKELAQAIGINAVACTSLQEALIFSIEHMYERMPEVFSTTPSLNPLLICGSLYLLGDVFSLFPFLLKPAT